MSAAERETRLQEMAGTRWDALVIGGGITGAGIALDAASRGMRVALIEMQDFAAGTSSRSTKLVHGGLRYLKRFEVKMVAEVGKERAVVYENGPHVTTPEWMLLPIFRGGTFGRLGTSLGLRVYDFLAGVNREERRRMLGVAETLGREPLLKKQGLKGGGYYVEYRTDDARLTIEVVKKAVETGAVAVNYAKAEELLYEGGRLVGAAVRDTIGGGVYPVRALRVVNATGPWVDTLRELDRSKHGKTLRLTKGIHLVFDQSRFPLRQAIYFDTPDGRMIFAIPRGGKAYVGTTDTDYEGDTARPTTTEADRDYVLAAANGMFPDLRLTAGDVESSWAGLRPLICQEGKSPSEVSRKDEIFRSASGLLTIAGGKLTGYRKMAETVADQLARELAAEGRGPFAPCRTRRLPIAGGDVGGSRGFEAYRRQRIAEGVRLGLTPEEATRLAGRYGSNVGEVYARLPEGVGAGSRLEAPDGGASDRASASAGGEPCAVSDVVSDDAAGGREPASVTGGLAAPEADPFAALPPALRAELAYAIEREMAVKPVDFFIRRTGALFFDIGFVRAWKRPVIAAMAARLGYTAEEKSACEAELERHLREAVEPSAP